MSKTFCLDLLKSKQCLNSVVPPLEKQEHLGEDQIKTLQHQSKVDTALRLRNLEGYMTQVFTVYPRN